MPAVHVRRGVGEHEYADTACEEREQERPAVDGEPECDAEGGNPRGGDRAVLPELRRQ